MIEIEETTIGDLNGVAVGVGNIWERDYRLPDGRLQRGLSAQLHIADERLVVGKGSVFDIGTEKWEVVTVGKTGDLGVVSFRQIDCP